MRVYATGSRLLPNCHAVKNSGKRENINFGYKMHILDSGTHADTMMHFAKALCADIADYTKLTLHETELLPFNKGLKSLESLDANLAKLETENIIKPNEFLTIPCTAPIELNTLCYHFNSVCNTREKFTPQNIKDKKDMVLEFLEKLPNHPYTLSDMDSDSQGLKYVPSIIKTINKLVKKGVNVYIPSDHPLEAAIKWKAGEMGIKDYLYRYISTGKDTDGQINKIINDLKAKNAYKFNLLTLSDAHIVNLQNRLENGDYIFSAYDSCVTDRARGVYNFYPVRDVQGNIQGFSFTDKSSIHYTAREFAGSHDIENIAPFVGRKFSDFSYEGNLLYIARQFVDWEEPLTGMPNVPYPIGNIYSAKRIAEEKLSDKGTFVDRTETLFFDRNSDGELIFRKCDCEGSGRPSVASMWGSCFAAVNLMTKTVRNQLDNLFNVKIPHMMKLADESEKAECYPAAENLLKKALELARPEVHRFGFRSDREYDIYTKLFNLYVKQGRADDAEKLVYDAFPDGNTNMFKYIKEKVEEMRRNIANDKTKCL